MKVRAILAGATLLGALALAPAPAAAQAPCVYTQVLGLGGSLSGCFQFTLSELGENTALGDVNGANASRQFYWNGSFTGVAGAPANAPVTAGTEFFNNDCGASGYDPASNFKFCAANPDVWIPGTTTSTKSVGPISNASGELVLGMFIKDIYNPSNGGVSFWEYSGISSRNAYPAPTGAQMVLYQVIGAPAGVNEYLLAWEDLNSGCSALVPTGDASITTFKWSDLGNKTVLQNANDCTSGANPPQSDNDYNDSYILLDITGTPQSLTPEPMTMTLMATGLVGLAGAQIRRRKKN